jgi:hypothetical protein
LHYVATGGELPMGHWLGGELVRAHTHVYIHRYLPDRARALSDRQQSNEALFSPLLGCAF